MDSGHTLHILHHEEPEEDDEGGITINSKSFETGAMLPLNANGNVAKGANPQAVERHPRSLIYVPTRKTRKRTNESYVTEVLDIKNMTVKEVIDDFVKSKDKRFAGKSRKERIKMALGAYYGEHPRKRTTTKEEYRLQESDDSKQAKIDAIAAGLDRFGSNVPAKKETVAELTAKQKALRAKYNDINKKKDRDKSFLGRILKTFGLSKQSEQVLTNLYNTLNEENREKMIKLMESEEGFIKLIEFAVEKGID